MLLAGWAAPNSTPEQPAAPEPLHIDFRRSGGFAGEILATSVDTTQLSPQAARELAALVQQADFFALPEQPSPLRQPPPTDTFQYDLTITQGSRRHHVSRDQTEVPATLQPLIDRLTDMAQDRRVTPGAAAGGGSDALLTKP